MPVFRVHALVLGNAVVSDITADRIGDAAMAFQRSARIVRVMASKQHGENGQKLFDVTVSVNGEDIAGAMPSNSICGLLERPAPTFVEVIGVAEASTDKESAA